MKGQAGSIIFNFCYLGALRSSFDEGWWDGAESLIRIFIPGVTEVNADAGLVQDFISSF